MMNLIFDIGASEGVTIDQFLNKSRRIVAFEPNPILFTQLKHKYGGLNVHFDPRALSDSIGQKTFHVSSSPGISTFSERWMNESRFSGYGNLWPMQLVVDTTTLDRIILEYGVPDFIKIDVEAHELEVITSFSLLLEKTIICFEWHEEMSDDLEKILNHFKELGYTNFYSTDGDSILWDYQIDWTSHQDLGLLETLEPERKERWGMVYVKY